MKQYLASIENYGSTAEQLHAEVIGMVLNIVVDKAGNIATETEFTKNIYLLRDSVLYRLSSLGWHLHSLCKQHAHFERLFKANPKDPNIIYAKNVQSFAFDDFVFNLVSLYDYFANLIAFFLISENKKRTGWDGLAKAAMHYGNKFSSLPIAADIARHENEWVKRIRNFRAEVIHYNLSVGKGRRNISWKQGGNIKFELIYSVPEKLTKKLKLQSPVHENVGVDLQFGTLEIAERSARWLADITATIRKNHTSNTIKKV